MAILLFMTAVVSNKLVLVVVSSRIHRSKLRHRTTSPETKVQRVGYHE